MTVAIPLQNIWYLSGLHSLSQKWDVAKTAVGHRLDAVRAKIAPIQNKIGQGAATCWNQLTPSAQRHIQLVWTRDAGQFVGLEAPYEKNVVEKFGDWCLWPSVDLPKELLNCRNSPIALSLASIGGTFLLLKLIFTPRSTVVSITHGHTGSLSLLTKMSLIGLVFRSAGRWTNSQLMDRFHQQVLPNQEEGIPRQLL